MIRLLLLLLSLGIVKIANTQSISTQMGARGLGMGNASYGIAYEWGLFNNIASTGLLNETSAAAAYQVNSLLPNANRMAMVINCPLKLGVLAAGAFRFGDDLYNEQLISAGFANTFGITTIGLKTNFIQYQAQGFGTHQAISFDLGGLTRLTEVITISAGISNLIQSKIRVEGKKEILPTRLTAGLAFRLSENVIATTELEKEISYSTQWRTGLEYNLNKKFFARTGFNLSPTSGFFGLGAHKKLLQADYAIQLNAITGASHQASVTYKFNRKRV
ncbi:MAG: hypothetical protein KF856_18810 [Cyclobacteriaceae bacterium]|nr:hypothetical protein [Cyclobacteriaceae bacterium]